MSKGRFGVHGGQYIRRTLMNADFWELEGKPTIIIKMTRKLQPGTGGASE